jgi:acyl carrier protein
MDSFEVKVQSGPHSPDAADAGRDLGVPAIVAELARLLAGLGVVQDGERIDPHAALFDGGLGLDSIAVLELIALIEQRYQISFPAEDLNTEIFANLAAVARQVHTLLHAGCQPGSIA